MKFTSDVNGWISGIRFYKASTNTGVHTGSLWTSGGTQLATATFTGETASGWQQVNFSTPVAITANTVYVASYHTNVGRYSVTENYFTSAGYDNPPLHALRDGASGGNGVYALGANTIFPTSTYHATNYWVDVVFVPMVGPAGTATQTPTATPTPTVNPVVGAWSGVLPWPLVAINATLLRTGEVLVWDGGTSVGDSPTHGGLTAQLWNPDTQVFTAAPTSRTDLFCAGSCALSDGRIFVPGGSDPSNNSVGTTQANIFNPTTRQWSAAASMSYRRWYPTATCLPDGRVLVISGTQLTDTDYVTVPEVYNPTSNTWSRLTQISASIPYYPHVFVLPDGRVLESSNFKQPMASDVLTVSSPVTRTVVDSRLFDGGSAVMYRPGKILKAGSADSNSGSSAASAATAYVLDMTAASPAWRQVASMRYPRTYHTLTALPDGNVLVTGGGRTKSSTDVGNAVYAAEMWSPQTETWTELPPMQRPRLYHSIGLLLPDGRVLVAGSGRNFRSALKEMSAEIYSPPYLFAGPRPVITSAPANVTYGASFSVQTPDAASIASAVFMRPGSVTHGIDQDQRYLPLTFQATTGTLTVQAPANANLAPPGYYMLFLVNSSGVPSVAAFVRIS